MTLVRVRGFLLFVTFIVCAAVPAAAQVEFTYSSGSAIAQSQANRYTDLSPDICEDVQPPNPQAPPLSISASCSAQRAGDVGGSANGSSTSTVVVSPSIVGTAPNGKPLVTGVTITVTANASSTATSAGAEQENKMQALAGVTSGASLFFKGTAGMPVTITRQVSGMPQGQSGCFGSPPAGSTTLSGGGALSANVGCIADTSADVNGSQSLQYTATLTLTFGDPPSGDIVWDEPSGGDFDDAENWEPPQVPEVSATRADTAVFNLANTYPVNVSGAKAKRLVIRNSSIDLVGGTAQATSSSPSEPSLVIGQSGKLHLVSGTLSTVDSVLGDVSGGGLAEVDLISSAPTWTNTGRLTIGDAGPGRLTVVSGQVTSAESRIGGGMLGAGEAIVGGPGAWTTGNLGLGLGGGAGTLEIKDGGQVTSDAGVIGVAFSSGNVATVTGSVPGNDTAPSTWTLDGSLAVGKDGAGQLDVLAGAHVVCDTLRIATATSGAGDVRVKGSAADAVPPSTLDVEFLLDVGATGVGTLAIEDGGMVNTFTLGVGVNGPGTVTIEGERIVPIPGDPAPVGSILTATLDATVGVAASGEVRIRDGGHLGTPLLVVGSQASGLVAVDDGSLATTQLIRLGGNAVGTLEVRNGGTVLANAIDLGEQTNGDGRIVLAGETPIGQPGAGFPSSIITDGHVRVGVLGKATLEVRNGAEMIVKAPGRLEVTTAGGGTDTERAQVTVRGAGTVPSRIDARSDVRIGGRGEVEVLEGGLLSVSGAALLGGGGAGVLSAKGVRTGNGASSLIMVTGNMVVGTNVDGGGSVLAVTEGARVTVGGTLFVGALSGDAFVIVDGATGATPSRLDVTGPIRVSEDSLLSITVGAQVTSASAIVGDEGPGTVAIGSAAATPAWAVTGTLDVGTTGRGELALCPGGIVTASGVVTIGSQGTLRGTQTIVTPQLVNAGTVAPGCSPGTLVIDGEYVQHASGRLRIEIGGTAPGTFDVLQITGNATLDGTLEIAFVDGFVPRTGDALAVLQVLGSVVGDFTDLAVSGLPAGWKLEPTRDGNVFGFRIFGDYLCYRTSPASGAKFPKALPGTLATALGALDFAITKPVLLCNPSGPSTGSAQNEDSQLRGYAVSAPSADPLGIAARRLRVTNGLHPGGELLVDTAATTLVLANAARCVDVPLGTCPTDLAAPSDDDAFVCAPAKRSKAGPAFPKLLVASAVDRFGEPRTYKLAKPTRVCAPTTGDLTEALACYAAKPLGKACAPTAPVNAAGACKSELDCGGTKKVTRFCAKQSKHAKVGTLVLATTLARDRAGTVKPIEFCVLSTLSAP